MFQAKKWRRPVGHDAIEETLVALKRYRADVPVIVSLNGFESAAFDTQAILMSQGIPLQLWDRARLLQRAGRLSDRSLAEGSGYAQRRAYQEDAIEEVVRRLTDGHVRNALVVMATGLGKTFVAAEAMRRVTSTRPQRILVLAHTNELVYQLERAFWPLLRPSQETVVWNGQERPDSGTLAKADLVFGCIDTVAKAVERGDIPSNFDVVIIDECHHAGATMYGRVLDFTRAGREGGPFLLGLTATPWRADGADIQSAFGEPAVAIDLVTGMRRGFLANVDYRIYTSNIDWKRLGALKGSRFTPKAINRVLFIAEWDDGVVYALKQAWEEQAHPRAIVFCGTIDHAIEMRDRINALGFCNAAALFSASSTAHPMQPWERNRILADFDQGAVGVVCAVDIFNEGIDVPDVNIIVFQRVTHSRRIFIQQLGRGLRLAPGKEGVIVLDFVSDVRRFAAGLDLKHQLDAPEPARREGPVRVRLRNRVSFVRVGGYDPDAETFLSQWLGDLATIEEAGDDASVLRFPPVLPPSVLDSNF